MAGIDSFASQQAYLEHVVTLVQQLYNPAFPPSQIDHIQTELQQHQRSPAGWIIGDALLGHPEQNVQFFGALTLTIKINQDAVSLDDESMQSLRDKLLSWLLTIVDQGDGGFVVRKLCSSLVSFSTQPNATWKYLIRHVACCFTAGEVVDEPALEHFPPTDRLVAALKPAQVSTLLALTAILAEDASRVPHNTQFSSFHAILERSLPDAVLVMTRIFDISTLENSEYHGEVLQCYQSWNVYARESYSSSSEQSQDLQKLLRPLMGCLVRTDMFLSTAEFFIDALIGHDISMLNKEDAAVFSSLLQTDWANQQLTDLEQQDPDEEAIVFGQLVLAFGQANARDLVNDHEASRQTLLMMHRVTRAQKGEGIDQGLANAICDFWDTYTLNVPYGDSEDPAEQAAHGAAIVQWMQAIEELCTAATLHIDEQGEFVVPGGEEPLSEFRARVRSSIQASYDDFGASILQKLVSMALTTGQDGNLAHCHNSFPLLEIILFCLADLATSMEYHRGDESKETFLLESLFTSALFGSLVDFSVKVPVRVRKRAITIIGDQDNFFDQNPSHLMSAIDMLFGALRHAELAESATRAIYSLADSGRKHFVNKVDSFCGAVPAILSSSGLTEGSKENFVAGVAFVLQAMPLCASQAKFMHNLIDGIMGSSPDPLDALGQLEAVGKAIQAPSDTPIDVDNDEGGPDGPTSILEVEAVNAKLISSVAALLGQASNDGQLLVAVCDVIRTGYRELPPGYFVFASNVTADLISSVPLANERLDYAVSTAAAFLTSRIASIDKTNEAKLRLVSFVGRVIEHVDSPSTDPEVAHACVEFIARLIPIHLSTLSSVPTEHTARMLHFTLRSLAGADVLPKKAAANLWTAIISLSSSDDLLGTAMEMLGPDLTKVLIFNFGGNAARSELDGLSNTFRKLVFRQPHVKMWIEAALAAKNFPSDRASETDKQKFLAQVMHCRGNKKTDDVVRDFWIICRGTPAGYSG